jgi:asparagine synthase (glutamine-hydrolysing)
MCGINGVVGLPDAVLSEESVRRMSRSMSHRGPDAEGVHIGRGVALGHRRLSIIDLSTAANQPLKDSSGRYVIVFNGEVYNFMEIRAQLAEFEFHTGSDTEVVLNAFIKWGPECLFRFRGMFAFAIWDERESSLFLARDRFGVKPLYYHVEGDRLLFASEVRSLLDSGLVPRRLCRKGLVDYLRYQSAVAPLTLVKDVMQLPAGHHAVFRNGALALKSYWAPEEVAVDAGPQDPVTVRRRIRELIFQSVERRMVSDVPVGAFLSGGIDSSAVVAVMAAVGSNPPTAFTVGFDEKEYDESAYAELVARKYGVQHEKVLLRPDHFLEGLPEALRALDTPSGDGINTYIVSKAIRRTGLKVALSGIGGDELFVGYPVFGQFKSLQRGAAVFNGTRLLRKAIAGFLPSGDQKSDRRRAMLKGPSVRIEHIYPLLRQIQTDAALGRLTKGVPVSSRQGTLEQTLHSKRDRIHRFGDYSQVSIAEYLGYTQHVLLKDADQMSMAVSLEIREPFFDHDLVEYVLGLPDSVKGVRYPKQLLVESLSPLIPDEVVHRRKQGFLLPYDVWMRNELSSFCSDRIRSLAKRGFMDGDALNAYWDEFMKGKGRIRWTDIWVFVVLEDWLASHGIE